jgi:hypothetical protein
MHRRLTHSFDTQAATMAVLAPSYVCDTFTIASLISRLPQTNVSATQSVSLVLQLASSSTLTSIQPSCARSALTVIDGVLLDAQSEFPTGLLTNEVHIRLLQELEAASFAVGRLTTPTLSLSGYKPDSKISSTLNCDRDP